MGGKPVYSPVPTQPPPLSKSRPAANAPSLYISNSAKLSGPKSSGSWKSSSPGAGVYANREIKLYAPASGFDRFDKSSEQVVIDTLFSDDEDPFSLESLGKLIALSHAQQKDYLIARVITQDPHDESRTYASYYDAHHINKVLFRTQPEQGMLHRMKAKNPLNNMTIIGDVLYFSVQASETMIEAGNANKLENCSSSSNDSSPQREYLEIQMRSGKSSPSRTPPHPKSTSPPGFITKLATIFSPISSSADASSHPQLRIHARPGAFESTPLASIDMESQNLRSSPTKSIASSPAGSPIRLSPDAGILASERPRSQSPLRRRTSQNHKSSQSPSQNHKSSQSPSQNHNRSQSPSHNGDPLIAHYFASCDDFLMDGTVRRVFATTALTESDAVLFTLPTTTSTAAVDDQEELLQHPLLPEFMFSLSEGGGGGVGWSFVRVVFSWWTLRVLLGILAVLAIFRK